MLRGLVVGGFLLVGALHASRPGEKGGGGLLRYMVSLYRLLHRQLLRPDDTGHMLLNRGKQHQERIGGVRYTAEHGVICDAERPLADV